jgi:hypothetical protein
MNTPIERLQTALETPGLKAVEARLGNVLEQASKKEPSYDFLGDLLSCEVEARRACYLRARLQWRICHSSKPSSSSISVASPRWMSGRLGSCVRCGLSTKPAT